MPYRETVQIRERKAAQRRALLEAAEALVREQGFAGLTIQALAARAKVAVGTVYRYFDGKQELATEVFRTATEREVRAVGAAMRQGPGSEVERLRQALRLFAGRALRAPRLAWALIAEPVDPAVDQARLEYREVWGELFRELLEAAIAAGELPAQDTARVAPALVGAMAETLIGPLATPGSDDRRVIETLETFCLRATGATP